MCCATFKINMSINNCKQTKIKFKNFFLKILMKRLSKDSYLAMISTLNFIIIFRQRYLPVNTSNLWNTINKFTIQIFIQIFI